MESNQNSHFAADKIAEMNAHHANYVRVKEELLANIAKATGGKRNTLDNLSAGKWLPYLEENPKTVTSTQYDVNEFIFKVAADVVLTPIEALEEKDRAYSKALRDIVSSDLRFFWTTAEDFYIVAADKDSILKEKYKTLPSLSPNRKSDTEIEKDFEKLKVRRNKKNGDSTDTKAA